MIIGTIYKWIDVGPQQWTLAVGPARNVAAVWLIWWCIANQKTIVGRVLEWQPLRCLCASTYSLYLWQQPFLGLNKGWICEYPQNMVAVFAVALLSYYGIELPCNRLRDRFRLTAKPERKEVKSVATDALLPTAVPRSAVAGAGDRD